MRGRAGIDIDKCKEVNGSGTGRAVTQFCAAAGCVRVCVGNGSGCGCGRGHGCSCSRRLAAAVVAVSVPVAAA